MDDLARVQERVAGLGSAIVAFSGGVDSSLVAAVAARALGTKALAITAVSPRWPPASSSARATSRRPSGSRTRPSRPTSCTARPTAPTAPTAATTASPSSTTLSRASRRRRGTQPCSPARTPTTSATGARAWRQRASTASCTAHRAPQGRVRELAEALGVPSARKPASPCLASRIPYGTAVTPGVLLQIDRAERAVKALGFEELRVRHFGALGRLELPEAALARVPPVGGWRLRCGARCAPRATTARSSGGRRCGPARSTTPCRTPPPGAERHAARARRAARRVRRRSRSRSVRLARRGTPRPHLPG